MNKGLVVGVIVVLLVLVGGGVWYINSQSETKPVPTPTTSQSVTPTSVKMTDDTVTPAPGTVKEFVIEGASLKFTPNIIKVKKGDTVRVTLKNPGSKGMHDFVIDEFDVATSVLGPGEEEEIEFVADKVGTFEFYCSVEDHREMGMVGSLVVE